MGNGRGRWWLGVTGVLIGTLLIGCSSGGRHYGGLKETLSIDLRPNNSKLFVYQLDVPDARQRPLVQVYRSPKDVTEHRRREPLGSREYRQLRSDAERAVTLTGYCREGFLELDYRLSRAEMWLRGECREGATEDDRNRFAERSQLPIPQPE
ncbi:hypothetical protein OOT55_11705 [Marinimicrobium sp. C6131]|uniref:hypothetical protein n=1 Tax=Marinimicrobium sp. C6131 TaxID=3022676 RepID=UPI00223D8FB4|nr:hypothetical protein [Marinimicrobium sp. C6131]UZJ43316.1 hypothetical protein OOT55_11705 [Marinimicrobium sp. C6131]